MHECVEKNIYSVPFIFILTLRLSGDDANEANEANETQRRFFRQSRFRILKDGGKM